MTPTSMFAMAIFFQGAIAKAQDSAVLRSEQARVMSSGALQESCAHYLLMGPGPTCRNGTRRLGA